MAKQAEENQIKTRNRSRVDAEPTETNKPSPAVKPKSTPKTSKKPATLLKCYECMLDFDISDIKMDLTTFLLLQSMEERGSRWHCSDCLKNPKSSNQNPPSAMKTEIDKMKNRIEEMETNMEAKLNTVIESLNSSITAKPHQENSKSWAEMVCGDKSSNSGEFVQKIAKQVANKQKQIALERDERENNIIIFNVPEENGDSKEKDANSNEENKDTNPNEENKDSNSNEENKDSNSKEENKESKDKDALFFKSLCKDNLELGEFENVKVTRLGIKRENNIRPIKVIFGQNWDKRKFLSSLFKLKNNKNFANMRVSHDMTESDRMENKRLLKEAHRKNEEEKPDGFKYKVRGPPWAMEIVKVQLKN